MVLLTAAALTSRIGLGVPGGRHGAHSTLPRWVRETLCEAAAFATLCFTACEGRNDRNSTVSSLIRFGRRHKMEGGLGLRGSCVCLHIWITVPLRRWSWALALSLGIEVATGNGPLR